MRRSAATLFLTLLALLEPHEGFGAAYSLPSTIVHELPRSSNGRDYSLYVWTPASYATAASRKYPVVYVCDGYWDFPLIVAEIQNLIYDGLTPECLIVGIGYQGTAPDVGLLRQYDLTPGASASDPAGTNSGHAREFLTVIKTEIIPFVDGHYRSDTTLRMLTGGSYGGLFAVYSTFEEPNLFQGVVADSPALWWRAQEPLAVVKTRLSEHRTLNTRLFIGWGSDESSSITSTSASLYALLRASIPTGFSVTAREITGERHAGAKGEIYNRGLRYVFEPKAPKPSYAPDKGFGNTAPLINLSTRGRISSSGGPLIAGFHVSGREPKRILVRAVGPGLASFGVTDALKNPTLRVVAEDKSTVATNDDWSASGDANPLITAAQIAGAFPLAYSSSDAALVVQVYPGTYTAVVDSADANEGTALVEIYEITP